MSAQANHQSPENSVSGISLSRARSDQKLEIPTQNSMENPSIHIRAREEEKQQEVVVPNHHLSQWTRGAHEDRIRASNRFPEPSTGSTGSLPLHNLPLFSSFSPLISNTQNLDSQNDVAPSRSAFRPVMTPLASGPFSGAPLINPGPVADQQIPESNNLGLLAINTMQQVQELIAVNNSLLKLQQGQQMILQATASPIIPLNLDNGINPLQNQSLEEDCNCPLQIKIQKQLQRRSLSRGANFTVKNQSLQLEMIHRILQNQMILDKLNEYMTNSQGLTPSSRKISDKIKLKIKQAQADMIYFLSEIADPNAIVLRGQPRGKVRTNGEPFTSSEYRGVCKNGVKYQVGMGLQQMFIMIDGKKKMYLGGFETAQAAGRAYDRAAIQLRGIKAHTNHNYTKKEALEILGSEPIFKVYNRSEMPEVPQV